MYLDMIMSAVLSVMQPVLRSFQARMGRMRLVEMTTMSLAVPMSVV